MIDQFGRRIEYARVSVTDRCNLRCRYCMPSHGVQKIEHDEVLSYEEILRVVKIFSDLGIKKIRLTGGEPLLRKNIVALIRAVKGLDGVEQVALTTNGVLLGALANDLIAAGIDGLNVSLDTRDAKIFAALTQRDLLGEVWRGLQTFLNSGFKNLKLNCVPLRGVNDDPLPLVELARDNPVKVRFIELMPIGCAVDSKLFGVPVAEIFSRVEKVHGKLIPVPRDSSLQGPAIYFRPKNFVGQVGFIDALEHKFCSSCNRVRLTADGFTFRTLPIGTRLQSGSVVFEITQVGKECHNHCAIYRQLGDCIMPREGVFARVLHGGKISVGDALELMTDKIFLNAAVITASDRSFHGEREDLSGPTVAEMLTSAGYGVVEQVILPDDKQALVEKMIELANFGVGLVVTTGGTGFSVRDVTPEATLEVCDRLAPGIPEAMRSLSMQVTRRAMLSRAVAGIRKRTLIVNLPGSVKAVRECLTFVLPELRHGIEILRGEDCGH